MTHHTSVNSWQYSSFRLLNFPRQVPQTITFPDEFCIVPANASLWRKHMKHLTFEVSLQLCIVNMWCEWKIWKVLAEYKYLVSNIKYLNLALLGFKVVKCLNLRLMFLSLGRMRDIYPVLECNVTWPGPGAAWQCHECHAGRVRVSPVSQSDIIQTSRLCTLSVSECHSVSTLALSPGGGGHNESQIWKCFIPLPRGNMRTILLIPLFFLPGMLLM